jgi:hypothetical protein
MCLIRSAIVGGSFCAAAIGMCDVRTAFVACVVMHSGGGCTRAADFVGGVSAASLLVGLIGRALGGRSCARSDGMCLGGSAFVGCPGAAITGVCGSGVAFDGGIGAAWLSVRLV